jgi:hypothetical protein
MTFADLIIKLGLDSKGVSKGADTAVKEFRRISESAASFAAGFLGAGAILAGLARLSEKTVEYAGKLTDLKAETNTSTDALQEFDFAASQNGATLDDVSDALRKVAKNQVDALGGDTGKQNAFARLGVSLKDLKSLNPEEIFRRIAAQVQQLPESAQLTADVMEALGKSATKLIPAFKNGFADAADQARQLGLVIDEEILTKLDALSDDWDVIGLQMRSGLAPVLGWLTDQLREAQARAFGFMSALISLGTNLTSNPKRLFTNPREIITEAAKEGLHSYQEFKDDQTAATATRARRKLGGAPEAEEETRTKKLADLRKKNADALNDLYEKQLSREERITYLHQRRAEIARQLATVTDPLKREELVSQDIDALKGMQSLKTTVRKATAPAPAVDEMARRGLFNGGMPQLKQISEQQLSELRNVNRNLQRVDRSLNAEY